MSSKPSFTGPSTRPLVLIFGLFPSFFGGCTGISIEPSCPRALEVGESGPVSANEQEPGAIPAYHWDAIPLDAGTFSSPEQPDTTFQALKEGWVELRLTASDGLYQVISSCRTFVRGTSEVAVTLAATPSNPTTGQTVTLRCTSIGATAAVNFELQQIAGPRIRLTEVSAGVVTLVPLIAGSPRFQCVGETDDGMQSAPASLTLSVRAPGDSGNDNQSNGNENVNDNSGGGRR